MGAVGSGPPQAADKAMKTLKKEKKAAKAELKAALDAGKAKYKEAQLSAKAVRQLRHY